MNKAKLELLKYLGSQSTFRYVFVPHKNFELISNDVSFAYRIKCHYDTWNDSTLITDYPYTLDVTIPNILWTN